MNISLKTFMPAAVTGLLTLSACSNVQDRAAEYMADKPYSEYLKVTEGDNTTLIQSRLDSVAYRDIFMGTKAAKDSALVAEFNTIAEKTRGYSNNNYSSGKKMKKIRESVIKQGITTRDLETIRNTDGSIPSGEAELAAKYQHNADNWAYRNFFKKAGIMDSEIEKKCDSISLKIRP